MGGWLERLNTLPAAWAYAAVGALVFLEDAVFIGLVVPGETAAILGGVAASLGHARLSVMTAVVVVAAIVGDSAGYEIGHRYGMRLLEIRPLARRRERLERAAAFVGRRGGPAVFLGRFVAFLRTAAPFLAGASHLRYRTFLAYNVAGGIAWGVSSVLLGYVAGVSYRRVARTYGEVSAAVVVVLIVGALIAYRAHRRRRQRRA